MIAAGLTKVAEKRRFRIEANTRDTHAQAALRVSRRGGRVVVEVEHVEPKRMEPAIRMLTELMSRQRSPWLYRGPRWAGRRVREALHAGPLRAQLEAKYGPDGWLEEAQIRGPGFEARIVREQGGGEE